MKFINYLIFMALSLVVAGCGAHGIPGSFKNDTPLEGNYSVSDIGLHKATVRHEDPLITIDIDSKGEYRHCTGKDDIRGGLYYSRRKCEPFYLAPDYLHKVVINKETGVMLGISLDRYITGKITSYWIMSPPANYASMEDKELAGNIISIMDDRGNIELERKEAESKSFCKEHVKSDNLTARAPGEEYSTTTWIDAVGFDKGGFVLDIKKWHEWHSGDKQGLITTHHDNLFCKMPENDREGLINLLNTDIKKAAKTIPSSVIESLKDAGKEK